MANLTELFFRVHLRADAPACLLDWLELVGTLERVEPYDDGHPFFARRRWWVTLVGVDPITTPTIVPTFLFQRGNDCDDRPILNIHSTFRNYDSEVTAFVDWITQWVDADPGDFLGYSLYDDSRDDNECERPDLIHMPSPT
jgi:hypothetical protein